MRKTAIALAAAVFSLRLAGTAGATFTTDDLDSIADIIDSGSWVELRAYVEAHPDLLLGSDILAQYLLEFMSVTSNLYAALIFEPSMFPNLALVDRGLATDRRQVAAIAPVIY